ncbi:CCAAT/enhancer binding protein (C/EBP), beta [Columba livia]|uniref:CCAAT/enhancer binding protein (C/EBP), beta n=1 Tax=Columba livia TaxID=8932 RepID=A0A2I0M5R8_COLLI|nr:CCAAT/enhancer binding protein (C/EBP), beta [Columba livia]
MQRLVAWDAACLPIQPPAFKSMEVANFYYEADCLAALNKLHPRAAGGRSMTELTVGDHERAIDFSPYLDPLASQPPAQPPPPAAAAGGNFEPPCSSGAGQDFLSDLFAEDYKGSGGETKVEPVFETLDSCKGPRKEEGGAGPGPGGMSSPPTPPSPPSPPAAAGATPPPRRARTSPRSAWTSTATSTSSAGRGTTSRCARAATKRKCATWRRSTKSWN